MTSDPFAPGAWIWTPDSKTNHFAVFARHITADKPTRVLRVRVSASYHYELYVNGRFVNRGPVHGDPAWCHYDEVEYTTTEPEREFRILAVAHHSSDTHLHYLTPAPGGFVARVEAGGSVAGTDESWRCTTLRMWKDGVPARGWALDYCEDYDARLELSWWQQRDVTSAQLESWQSAVPVADAHKIWSGYQRRMTPYIRRDVLEPVAFTAWRAPDAGVEDVFPISRHADEEPLERVGAGVAYTGVDAVNGLLRQANAFTLDLGREHAGFHRVVLEAPRGTVLEVSGAELLQDDGSGRPWIFRKNVAYSFRFVCKDGKQELRSFAWSGFRYVHVVIRGDAAACRFHVLGALGRRADLAFCRNYKPKDERLAAVFTICRHTLEIGSQEHVVDCPTREQTPAFGDGLFAAESIWEGFCEPSYFEWYLEAFIRAPLNDRGLFCGRYPGTVGYWLDFCLIPLLGQRLYRRRTGAYYKPRATMAKALALKRWYDGNTNDAGLVDFPFREYFEKGFRNFIDHPGLGMHDAPHPGIDRDGTSCPLNTFFYGFVETLAALAEAVGDTGGVEELQRQAVGLRSALRETFFDGTVFHDAVKDGRLSDGMSWQTNSLAVYLGVAEPSERRTIMQAMIDGYDSLCRCTPYFHFYFLPALHMAGMPEEADQIMEREWGRMLDRDATTAWEGFLGDAKDSLCHPFSTPPFLYLLKRARGAEL
jgi:hypothetical protein